MLSPLKSFRAASHQWLWPSAAQPARNNVRTNTPTSRMAISFCQRVDRYCPSHNRSASLPQERFFWGCLHFPAATQLSSLGSSGHGVYCLTPRCLRRCPASQASPAVRPAASRQGRRTRRSSKPSAHCSRLWHLPACWPSITAGESAGALAVSRAGRHKDPRAGPMLNETETSIILFRSPRGWSTMNQIESRPPAGDRHCLNENSPGTLPIPFRDPL
jgi:hypothetical protein